MRVIMLMYDSLNRHMLPPYNAQTHVHAPNFKRLAQRTVTFDRSYVCSMACMPARRDLHIGRPNFLHNPWGPIQPYDDSMPQMLSAQGVYTHLVTDHYHYWEDGGTTYHNRYNSYELFRGQEGDKWKGQVADPPIPPTINPGRDRRRTDWVNRQWQRHEHNLPQSQTIDAGLAFIEQNQDQDNWFCQIETFDPHEPFVSHPKYERLYGPADDEYLFDWPAYGKVNETPEQVAQAQRKYSALVSKCDASLGEVLDAMDRHDMWQDTMLIVWTDHGFLLGEHDSWGKSWLPLYEEIAHTPFFVWDPRTKHAGQRRNALVQPSIDLAPTLLRFFGLEPGEHMTGHDLAPVIDTDQPVRDTAIFGHFGKHLNITDGRYTYHRHSATPDNQPLYEYTLMPTRMRNFIATEQLAKAELAPPFSFTKGVSPLRLPASIPLLAGDTHDGPHLLFDLESDPGQQQPLDNPDIEKRLMHEISRQLAALEAPSEQYVRLGLDQPADAQPSTAAVQAS